MNRTRLVQITVALVAVAAIALTALSLRPISPSNSTTTTGGTYTPSDASSGDGGTSGSPALKSRLAAENVTGFDNVLVRDALTVNGPTTLADLSSPKICIDSTSLTTTTVHYYTPVCDDAGATAGRAMIWGLNASGIGATIASFGPNAPASFATTKGRIVIVQNLGDNDLFFTLGAGDNAQNRLSSGGGNSPVVLAVGQQMVLWYNEPTGVVTDARWVVQEMGPTGTGTNGTLALWNDRATLGPKVRVYTPAGRGHDFYEKIERKPWPTKRA